MYIAVPIQEIQAFILVLFRVSGIIVFAPVLGSRAVPVIAKVGLALCISALLLPTLDSTTLAVPNDFLSLSITLAGELLIGLSMGLLAQVISAAVQFGGRILGFHMGFRIANVFDPQSEFTVSLLGAFLNLITVLILLSLDFHIVLLKLIKKSYEFIGPLSLSFKLGAMDVILRAGANVYQFALQVIAPILAAIFFIEVVIAVLAKTARQFNMLMLQFPIKILLGLIIVAATLKMMPRGVEYMLRSTVDQIGTLFRMLG